MPIVQKTLKDISPAMKRVYDKAMQTRIQSKKDKSVNSLQYAITLFKDIVKKDPGFMDARRELRDAEREYAGRLSAVAKTLAQVKSLSLIAKASAAKAKKPEEALQFAEEALAVYLYQNAALNILVEAGKKLNCMFLAAEGLELIVEKDDKNETNLSKLIEYYCEAGVPDKALPICMRLVSKYPDNLEFLARQREVAALISASEVDPRKIKAKEAAKADEIAKGKKDKKEEDGGTLDKVLRNIDDIKEEIAKIQAEIAAGDDSIAKRRKMAEDQMRIDLFEDAIGTYNWIVEKMGTLDPAIDKAIEKANVKIAERDMKKMAEEGRPQEEIDAKKKEIYDYRMGRYLERIRKYSNDLEIRFEYAELLWEGGNVDGALEQFQLAQRNPKYRLQSVVYLGRCFSAQKQYDMSIEQFTKALEDMPTMTQDKMATLYYLGCTYEDMGNDKEAFNCFKQIYSADITFKDVKEKIRLHSAKANA